MTAALNPTGIWDSSVRKAAEERLCGHVHGSRGNESRRGSLCARIHLDPTSRQRGKKGHKSYKRAADAELHERGGPI